MKKIGPAKGAVADGTRTRPGRTCNRFGRVTEYPTATLPFVETFGFRLETLCRDVHLSRADRAPLAEAPIALVMSDRIG